MSHYWLVANNDGSKAQVILSTSRPRRWGVIIDLGPAPQSKAQIERALASALLNSGQSLNITGNTIPIQGMGSVQTSDPGIAGVLDNLPGTVGSAINSTLDFLKFISWLFHPRNILRAVEFLAGLGLMVFGLHAALQARGERMEGFVTSEGALSRSALGRVSAELSAAAQRRERPSRPRSAPHRTRQRALQQRYRREEDLQRRRSKQSSSKRPKKTKQRKQLNP